MNSPNERFISMNNLHSVSKKIMTLSAVSLALTCACAHGGVYQSVFTLNSPYLFTPTAATQVVLQWATEASSGSITRSDLTYWSVSLRDAAGGNLYTDKVITGSNVNAIGGVSRSLSDVRFAFSFDTQSYSVFDAMYSGSLLTGATGMQYNAYYYNNFPGEPDDPLGIWRNGDESTRFAPGFSSHVFTSIPAPGAAALIGLAGLVTSRRRRN